MNHRLLNLARGQIIPLAITVLAGLLGGWLTIGQARGLSLIVDSVFLGGRDLRDVQPLLLFLSGMIILRSLLAWILETSANSIATRVKADLRARLFAKIQSLGPAFVKGERTGELTNTALEGVESLDAYFNQYLPQLALTALVPLSVLLFVFPIDLISGIVLLVTAPLIPVFMILIGKGAEIITKRQYETLSLLSAHFLDSLQGLTTLKLYGRSQAHAKSIAQASDKFRDVTLGVLRITFLSALSLELIATISTAVVAVEVGLRLLYGQIPFDKALFLLILAPEFYLPLRMLGLRFHAGMAGTTAAKKIFEVLDYGESDGKGFTKKQYEVLDSEKARISEEGRKELLAVILQGVNYTYPGETEPSLMDINLEIKSGEHIALVGRSGAGKSSLVLLLLGFISPTAGRITTIYRNSESRPTPPLHSETSWVPQVPHLFHDTILGNLRIAKKEVAQQEIDDAVKAACLDEFIQTLPEGLETVIGEEGFRLSAGQSQRIALARAFLKNAPILIMDEPTSSLDPNTEFLMVESTRKLMKGRTVITIAHRMNTIFHADRILVLEGGRIVDMGTHQALMAKNEIYRQMVHGIHKDEPLEFREGNFSSTFFSDRTSDQTPREPSTPLTSHYPILLQLLGFLRGSWWQVVLSILLGVLTVSASTGLMGTSAWLISTAALHPSIADLGIAIVGVRFFGISRGVFRYAERLVSHRVTFQLLSRLRVWFYKTLEPLAPARLAKYRTGDLLNRIVKDIDVLENFYVRVVSPPLVALFVSCMIAYFLGYNHQSLGWIYLGFAFIMGIGAPFLTHIFSKRSAGEMTQSMAAMRVRAIDFIQGLPDLLSFGRADEYREEMQNISAYHGGAQIRMARVTGISSTAGVLVPNLAMLVILASSIPLVRSGLMDGVMLAVLALVVMASFEAVQPLPLAAQHLSTSLASANRIFEIVRGIPGNNERKPNPQHHPQETFQLYVDHLSFSYSELEQPVLTDINFTLPKGRKIAIVGLSGAGKSTIVNLLLKFWEAQPGKIFINEQDILEIPEEVLRDIMSVISQRTYLFNTTIRDNILLANPVAGKDEINQACQQAGILDFINGLPKGFDTLVGERGARLSSGECQRIALARALLRRTPFLLLDEPTANLDPITEQEVLGNILANAKSQSILLITHRLVYMEKMDEILVLEHGRIVERGTHKTLQEKRGLYHRLFSIQHRLMVIN